MTENNTVPYVRKRQYNRKPKSKPISIWFICIVLVITIIVISIGSYYSGVYSGNLQKTNEQKYEAYERLCNSWGMEYTNTATKTFHRCYFLNADKSVGDVFPIITAQNGKYYIGLEERKQ